ncbi:unnamed protein product [Clonostachys solani]|uniref:DUF7136 domain-containing protein n=1 Tax=Clonostachys solani TaxID=160281 RepID=A0A9N9ZLL8_9HYPO|nr:unnamed protein product [Clonostachys solani]
MLGLTHAFSSQPAFLNWNFILLAFSGTAQAASAISEVDLVFPLNETYAPSRLFPIVFAFQSFNPATVVEPTINTVVTNYHNPNISYSNIWFLGFHMFNRSEPYFFTRPFDQFGTEGTWIISWELDWRNCNMTENPSPDYFINRNVSRGHKTIFTTHKDSSKQVDLFADINNEQACSRSSGATLNIIDTRKVPDQFKSSMHWGGDTCGVASLLSNRADPCRVKMNETVASKIQASMVADDCEQAKIKATEPAVSCPPQETGAAVQRHGIWGGVFFGLVITAVLSRF